MRSLIAIAVILTAASPAAAALPTSPNEVIEAAVIDLSTVPEKDRYWTRYLSLWPWPASESESLQSALSFWLNSLSWAPTPTVPRMTQDGSLWRIDLRTYGWSLAAWEALAKAEPYFAVTVVKKGEITRGWLDPKTELALRKASNSRMAVARADWFLARTSLDGEKGFRQQGFYSTFLGLPKTEKELFETLHAKESLKLPASTQFNTLFLLRGGASISRQVAQHDRGIEEFPTLVGSGPRFLWRSLDTDANAKESSVTKNLAGTIKVAGKEHIYSLPNGLHGYFACNGDGKRVAEVPTNIAQDKGHAFDVTVYLGWKCIRCHTPNGGINGFDDVIRRLMVGKGTGLGILSKDYESDLNFKLKIDSYYKTDLARDTKEQRESYTEIVRQLTGMTPDECAKNYLRWIEGYLYGKVDRFTAATESGFGEETDAYIKLTSPSDLVPLLDGIKLDRENFEAEFPRLMTAKIHDWEEQHGILHDKNGAANGQGLGGRDPAGRVLPAGGVALPAGARLLSLPAGYPAGAVRYAVRGVEFLRYRDGRRWSRSGDDWLPVGR